MRETYLEILDQLKPNIPMGWIDFLHKENDIWYPDRIMCRWENIEENISKLESLVEKYKDTIVFPQTKQGRIIIGDKIYFKNK